MPILPVLLLAVTAGSAADSRTVGPWTIDVEEGVVMVRQPADVAWSSGPPDLVLRCRVWDEKGKLIGKHHRDREAYLFYLGGFGSKDGDLLMSFDGEAPPKKYYGAPSVDQHSFFVFGGGFLAGPDAFIRKLRTHSKKLTVVVTPKKERPLPEVSFDLARLEEALTPLLASCPMK